MQLDVILRTHDGGSVHNYAPRIVDVEKSEIIRRCVSSLTFALVGVPHRLTILDDHSSLSTQGFLASCGPVVITGPGNNASLLDAIQLAGASTADFVYLIEDDYLHAANSIKEMLAFANLGLSNGLPSIAIHPYDDSNNYKDGRVSSCTVVPGRERHWRNNIYTTATLMAEPWLFKEPEWGALARDYGDEVHEGNTINRIWQSKCPLYTPMPSLAVHLNENEPPLFDWRSLWKEYDNEYLCVG